MSRHLIMNFYLFKKISSPCFLTILGVANISKAVRNLLNLKRFDLLTNLKFPLVFDS